MSGNIGSAIVIFSYGIIVFLLVRPNSQGPTLVSNMATGVANVIKAGTGGGTW